jgi:hypothetical protein
MTHILCFYFSLFLELKQNIYLFKVPLCTYFKKILSVLTSQGQL